MARLSIMQLLQVLQPSQSPDVIKFARTVTWLEIKVVVGRFGIRCCGMDAAGGALDSNRIYPPALKIDFGWIKHTLHTVPVIGFIGTGDILDHIRICLVQD